jgi:hypothetical protein
MALGSTQLLVKMSTRDVPGGKVGRCVRLTTYHHSADVKKSRSLNSPRPLWACMACIGCALPSQYSGRYSDKVTREFGSVTITLVSSVLFFCYFFVAQQLTRA